MKTKSSDVDTILSFTHKKGLWVPLCKALTSLLNNGQGQLLGALRSQHLWLISLRQLQKTLSSMMQVVTINWQLKFEPAHLEIRSEGS